MRQIKTIKITIDDKTKEFKSYSDAARCLGTSVGTISQWVNGTLSLPDYMYIVPSDNVRRNKKYVFLF